MTLEEYLNDDDGSDIQYELVNGNLMVMPPESELIIRIASLPFAALLTLVSKAASKTNRNAERLIRFAEAGLEFGQSCQPNIPIFKLE